MKRIDKVRHTACLERLVAALGGGTSFPMLWPHRATPALWTLPAEAQHREHHRLSGRRQRREREDYAHRATQLSCPL